MRAVIFANGNIRQVKKIKKLLKEDDFLVAADGGFRYLKALDRLPALLIGDLDSLLKDDLRLLQEEKVEILIFSEDKNETDLELAISEIISRGYREIIIVGGLGGRLDQTLANLSLLDAANTASVTTTMDDGHEQILLIRDRVILHGKRGDTISLIPICNLVHGVTTQGLAFPLNNETLYLHKTRGISNMMLSELAEISIKTGRLLCVHTRKGMKEGEYDE